MGMMTADRNPARVPEISSECAGAAPLNDWLERLVAQSGSDLLLVPEAAAAIRVEAVWSAIGDRALRGEEIEAAVLPALAAHAREEYQQYGIADSSYRVEWMSIVWTSFSV